MDLLYPGNSGYSAETGGKLKNLRTLSNQQVQRYHVENYTPDNCLFCLSGNIDPEKFFQALDMVEQNILSKPKIQRIASRPWMTKPVPLMDPSMDGVMSSESITKNDFKPLVIQFPSEDESRGTISIGWRGPTYESRDKWAALLLLWEYLTDSPASPLQKAFVECDEPLCADVSPANEIFTQGYHQLWFTEVETGKIDQVLPKLFHTLQKECKGGDCDDAFDMERMQMVIQRYRRQLLEYSERRPTYALMDGIIRNFLYAPRKDSSGDDETIASNLIKHLRADADSLPLLDLALKMKREDWQALLNQYTLSLPFGAIVGIPSTELSKKMANDEEAREAQQAVDFGPEKLSALGETLAKAIEFNERAIPKEALTSVPVPSLEKVKPLPILTLRGVGYDGVQPVANSGRGISGAERSAVCTKLQEKEGSSDGVDRLFHIDWNYFESSFLTVAVGLGTKDLSTKERLYLPIILELAFKLSATLEDGTTISKDDFVSQLQNDTVSYSASNGLIGRGISQMASFRVQIERDSQGLGPALQWLRRALYLTDLTAESVKMATQRLLSEIPAEIRHGPTVCAAVAAELNFCPTLSNQVAASCLRQLPFLQGVTEKLEDTEDSEADLIVQELNTIRRKLVQPSNMQVFVAGKLTDIAGSPMQALATALVPPEVQSSADSTVIEGQLMTDVSASTVRSDTIGKAAICSLSAIESSFLSIYSSGLDAYDSDLASLLVAIEYLTALEGDFWVKLRGAGLTYGSSISNNTESKLMKFSLFKCTDVAGAFAAASQILVDYASGRSKISEVGLESAKSSLAYSIISGTSTRLGAAMNSWVQNYEGKKVDYDQWLLGQVSKVTEKDAMKALVTYLVPIFDKESNLVVACPMNKAEEISTFFSKRGWADLQTIPEDKLSSTFVTVGTKKDSSVELPSDKLPNQTAGISMQMPGAFAEMFKCGCPRCLK